MEWKIGNRTIANQVVLAPMAGVSNPAYMKICAEMGVGYAITELISAEALVRDNQKTFDMLKGIASLPIPVAVQLFGAQPETLAKAAKIITDLYPNVLIDLNMGCPVPKVAVRAQAGSGLLKDPAKVKAIVEAVVAAVSVPVTVKIRSGWDKESINAVTIAQICEEAGAKAIAIHGRTRAQGYQGCVDLTIIKQVKDAVSIPVIGNGDIKTCYDAKQMMDITGCDAVMIGRATLGNPWLIRDCVTYLETGCEPKPVSISERITMILKHLDYLLLTKPEKVAILEMRSHAAWYLKGLPHNGEVRQQIMQLTSKKALQSCLEQYRKEVEYEG
ncbi:MAG: tRNA dihydrouridine synthase DusB [Bacilli bacterium]|jgi:tRNA-dihydrouridine synthase B|nr:tRNA dihydrouridine synthase DusB [Bacilli bacterium]